MMTGFLHQWIFAGLVAWSVSGTCIAAGPVVRDFNGWKVTITPGRFAASDVAARDLHEDISTSKDATKVTRDRRSDSKSRLVVTPVSFEQDGSDVLPVPVTEVAAPTPSPELATPPLPKLDTVLALQAQPAVPQPAPTVPAEPVPTLAPEPTSIVLPLPPSPAGGMSRDRQCPGCELPVITPRPSEPEMNPPSTPSTLAANYRDVYFSIPFIRSQYNANPTYRHDATMEFLFNQMRPTVINRTTTNVINYDSNVEPWYWDPPYYPYSYGLRIHRSR